MHKIDVVLALMAVDVLTPSNSRFAVRRKLDGTIDLPRRPLLKGGSSFEVAKQIYTEMSFTPPGNYIHFKQVGTYDQTEGGPVIILYCVTIPDRFPMMDCSSSWVSFDQLAEHPKLLTLIGHACNAYKII